MPRWVRHWLLSKLKKGNGRAFAEIEQIQGILPDIEQIQTYRIDRVWQYCLWWEYLISKQMYAIFSQCSINTQDQPTTNRQTKIGTVNAPTTKGYSIGGKWTRPTKYLNWLKYHKDTKYLNWLKTVKGQTWWKRGGGQIKIL